jgi:hypothetical protein
MFVMLKQAKNTALIDPPVAFAQIKNSASPQIRRLIGGIA